MCRGGRKRTPGQDRQSQVLELVGFGDVHRPFAHLQAPPPVEQLRLLHPWGVEDRRVHVVIPKHTPSCSPLCQILAGPLY